MNDEQKKKYDKAHALLAAEEYDGLIDYLTPFVESEEGWALAMMGYIYDGGKGVEMNAEKAIQLYQMSADQNDLVGQLMLGLHHKSQGDMVRARALLGAAHENGHPLAARECAWTYLQSNPNVSSDDFLVGLSWLRKSAELNNIESMMNLSTFLEMVGDEKSFEEALAWQVKVSNAGDARGSYNCGRFYERGIGTVVDFEKARQYYDLAVREGLVGAMHNLGVLHYNGQGGDVDKKIAFDLYNSASSIGSFLSTYLMGRMFGLGETPLLDEKSLPIANAMTILAKYQMDLVSAKDETISAEFNELNQSLSLDEKEDLVQILESLAKDNPNSKNAKALAAFYTDGLFIDKNLTKASYWESRDNNETNELVDSNFDSMFSKREGVTTREEALEREHTEREECAEAYQAIKDLRYDLSEQLFRPLAEQGNRLAMLDLARLHLRDLVSVPDLTYARGLLDSLARLGDASANKELGDIFSVGLGVTQDYNKSFEYYQTAAKQGDVEAMADVGYAYLNGLGVNKNVGSAMHWLGTAAHGNSGRACYQMGRLYLDGTIEVDASMASNFFERGATLGFSQCQNELGIMYRDGNGRDQNYEQAFHLFQLSADNLDFVGQYLLGCMFLTGLFVKKDVERAIHFLELSADQGFAEAYNELGGIYGTGNGVAKNREKSIELYKQAAQRGHVLANSNLAVIYINGDGVERDIDLGVGFLAEAARLGDDESAAQLVRLKEKYGIETPQTPSVH